MTSPDQFRERFALAAFPDGGIVIDLVGGGYALLNASAAVLLGELERAKTWDEATTASAKRLAIPPGIVARDMDALISEAGGPGISHAPIGPFRYQPSPDGGYDLWDSERAVLHADARGRDLSLLTPPTSLPFRIFDYVSEIAPRLLFLQGVTVLHGSGCHRSGVATGICGASRAGKTTTARTLAKRGHTLISEDLLVFDRDLTAPRICVNGEATVHAWTKAASSRLERHPRAVADATGLVEAATGPTVDLKALWFVDARRRGDAFKLDPLARPQALSMLIENAFLGASDRPSWRRHLASGQSIVTAIESYTAYLPDGLAALDEAILAYTTNSAS